MTARIGIIGCGGRMLHLLRRVPGLGRDIEVAALCDPDPRSIRAGLEELNPRARVYSDHRELSADPSLSWVFIGSWNCFHSEQAVVALEAGKNVFCEKPLATSLLGARAIRDAHRRHPGIFCIGFTLRYSSTYRKIKEVLDSGAIGRVVSMEFNETLHFDHGSHIHGNWRRLRANTGSHLLEKCCHDMDLALWMVGSLPARVASFGGLNFFRPENASWPERLGKAPDGRRAFSSPWSDLVALDPFTSDKDIVDNQVAILEFANGARATFHTNCATNLWERRMYLCCSAGTLRADLTSGLVEIARFGYGVPAETWTGSAGGHGGGDEVLGAELARAILEGVRPPTTLEHGLASAITCFGIDEAKDRGCVVDMDPLWSAVGMSEIADLKAI